MCFLKDYIKCFQSLQLNDLQILSCKFYFGVLSMCNLETESSLQVYGVSSVGDAVETWLVLEH